MYLGATPSCTKMVIETTEGIGQRDTKGATNDCFIFDSWFYSKRLPEAAMDVSGDMVGMVRTDTK